MDINKTLGYIPKSTKTLWKTGDDECSKVKKEKGKTLPGSLLWGKFPRCWLQNDLGIKVGGRG
jgi:hypothetical protein